MEDKKNFSLNDFVSFDLSQTFYKYKVKTTKFFKTLNLDLTPEYILILSLIKENPKIIQSDLVKLLEKDKSNISKIIDILVNKGYIKRKITKTDNKQVRHLSIEKKGIEILEVAEPLIIEIQNMAFDGISQMEIQILKTVLEKIRKNLEKQEV